MSHHRCVFSLRASNIFVANILLLRLSMMKVLYVIQVWTMVGIYLAVACVAVIIVAVFVDNLPSDLVDKKTKIRSEV